MVRMVLLAFYWCVFVESNHGEHFAGFFAGLCVYEEVLHEDLRGGGVRGTVLVVEVFFDVVLFADCFEMLGDLDCLSVGTGDSVGLWSGCHYDELEVSCFFPCGDKRGIDQLESFGFWRSKFCIKNAEILSVDKIAEFAKFAGVGKSRKTPDLVSDKQTAQWAFAASSSR